MITKLFEIRDRLTFIPAVAVRLSAMNDGAEQYLLERAGYRFDCHCVLLYPMIGEYHVGGTDPDETWGGGRTFTTAHRYILENWKTLKSGDVIDVEFILGETTEPKQSERLETGRGNVD
jgi:hypothetical protein